MKHPLPMRLLGLSAVALALALVAAVACKHVPGEHERHASARAAAYLVKDSTLSTQFRVAERGLELLDADTARHDRPVEAVIYWDEVPLFQRMVRFLPADTLLRLYQAKGEGRWREADFPALPADEPPFRYDPAAPQPLKGLRVALDPGHVGGQMDYAQFMEEKFVRIRPDTASGFVEEVAFCEGNLALGTALLLADRLRREGAEVLLTRETEGLNAFGITYEQWLDREARRYEAYLDSLGVDYHKAPEEKWRLAAAGANYVRDYHLEGKDRDRWLKQPSKALVHRIPFLKAEFIERARKINAFRPHLTLIIHYNVGEGNSAAQDGYRHGIPENYCMAFIPGSFMGGELKEPCDRLAFAAKLLCDDIPRSQALSAAVVRAHERKLGVPAMIWDDRLLYLKNASLLTPEKGVFARNLQLTRLVNGPLCFGESLYQDNLSEAKALNARDFTLPGMVTPLPDRIRPVAEAYYEGLLEWLKAGM